MTSKLKGLKEFAPAAGAGLAVLLLFIFWVVPTRTQESHARRAAVERETELGQTKSTLRLFTEAGLKRNFLKEENLAQAIEEMTKAGKALGAHFLLIEPKTVQSLPGQLTRRVPVEIEVEVTYRQWGKLLKALDELESGVATIRSFKADPKLREEATQVHVRMTVDFHLLAPAVQS